MISCPAYNAAADVFTQGRLKKTTHRSQTESANGAAARGNVLEQVDKWSPVSTYDLVVHANPSGLGKNDRPYLWGVPHWWDKRSFLVLHLESALYICICRKKKNVT